MRRRGGEGLQQHGVVDPEGVDHLLDGGRHPLPLQVGLGATEQQQEGRPESSVMWCKLISGASYPRKWSRSKMTIGQFGPV